MTKYTGRPRDIDSIKSLWTQVVINLGSAEDLVAQTRNDRIVRILLMALAMKADAEVECADEDTPRLTAATVHLSPAGNDGDVLRVSFSESDGYFRASIYQNGTPVDGWTDSDEVQSIVTTAAREGIPAEAAIEDPAAEIVRAKVNVLIEARQP